MEFNQLESFLSVVKHKSFSEAARHLYLTQPTVSSNIQSLERELNTTLLDRKSKTITLTESGKHLHSYALEIINTREKAKHEILGLADKIEGEIELDASSIPEQYILPYIIRDFTELYPNVTFSIRHKNSRNIVDDIIAGKQICGIVGAKYVARQLNYVDFYEDEIILAVPNNEKFHKIDGEVEDLEMLLEENFIFRKKDSGTRHLVEERLKKKGLSVDDLRVNSFIDSNEMIKKMIELELGISFISEVSIKNELALDLIKALRVADLDLKRNFYFVHCKNRTLSPTLEVFKNFLETWSGID